MVDEGCGTPGYPACPTSPGVKDGNLAEVEVTAPECNNACMWENMKQENLKLELEQNQKDLKQLLCSVPTINVGLGVDAYAGIGASISAGLNFDLAQGRFGVSVGAGIGVGLGIDAGTQYGASPSGGGVFSGNIGYSGGFAAPVAPGVNYGATVSKNVLGTNPGETAVGVGRAGTPTGFVNGQGNVAVMTPSLYHTGC